MKSKKIGDQHEQHSGHIEDWKSKYMRALADYQNLEKRTAERVNSVRLYASEAMLMRLLPVVDTFEKLKDHINDQGMDVAYKELIAVLIEQGVERMEVVGKKFDPAEMECIEVVEGKEHEVIEELTPGYRFRGKVLRVARVKVGTLAPNSN